jgi:hypothetical protein
MSRPESTFRHHIVLPFLKKLRRTHITAVQQIAIVGTADYILTCNGTPVHLELKAPNGKYGPLQEYNLKENERCGGVSITSDITTWEADRERLLKLDEGE